MGNLCRVSDPAAPADFTRDLVRWSETLAAIARTGLGFTQSLYERERYEEVLHVAGDIKAAADEALEVRREQDHFVQEWLDSVGEGVPGYVTPKVAVGAIVGNDKGEILLVQRPEPRNMIGMLLLGKQALAKETRDGSLSGAVTNAADAIAGFVREAAALHPALLDAGFVAGSATAPVQDAVGEAMWLAGNAVAKAGAALIVERSATLLATLDAQQRLQLDHAVCASGAIPAYCGGITGLAGLY